MPFDFPAFRQARKDLGSLGGNPGMGLMNPNPGMIGSMNPGMVGAMNPASASPGSMQMGMMNPASIPPQIGNAAGSFKGALSQTPTFPIFPQTGALNLGMLGRDPSSAGGPPMGMMAPNPNMNQVRESAIGATRPGMGMMSPRPMMDESRPGLRRPIQRPSLGGIRNPSRFGAGQPY